MLILRRPICSLLNDLVTNIVNHAIRGTTQLQLILQLHGASHKQVETSDGKYDIMSLYSYLSMVGGKKNFHVDIQMAPIWNRRKSNC